MDALHNASREELIDMIEERMDMDPAFRRIVEHRLKSDAASERSDDTLVRAIRCHSDMSVPKCDICLPEDCRGGRENYVKVYLP